MENIKRFFECLLPVSVCNLECPYCYVIQENRRKMELATLKYPPEHIVRALRKERVGGTCLISICGAGETLIQNEIIEIVRLLLNEGHYVNITTNGTISKKFDQLIEVCGDNISRLHLSFSLHYLELKRHNLLDAFFENVNKMRCAGASILVQINLYDAYIPYINEIMERCKKEVGAVPQVALTRDESSRPMKILTSLSDAQYHYYGGLFHSNLFEFTYANFNVKRKEFCYAGDWSGVLNLQTGWLSKCYENNDGQNIFENINEPIFFEAVGKNCHNSYCVNSSHFMSLGIIPSIKTPSYAELRNREEAKWYTDSMLCFLNGKLENSNKKYGLIKKWKVAWKNSIYERNRLKAAIKAMLPIV
mgnify:CR=1 FL=1